MINSKRCQPPSASTMQLAILLPLTSRGMHVDAGRALSGLQASLHALAASLHPTTTSAISTHAGKPALRQKLPHCQHLQLGSDAGATRTVHAASTAAACTVNANGSDGEGLHGCTEPAMVAAPGLVQGLHAGVPAGALGVRYTAAVSCR
jgi:hypothetical protein